MHVYIFADLNLRSMICFLVEVSGKIWMKILKMDNFWHNHSHKTENLFFFSPFVCNFPWDYSYAAITKVGGFHIILYSFKRLDRCFALGLPRWITPVMNWTKRPVKGWICSNLASAWSGLIAEPASSYMTPFLCSCWALTAQNNLKTWHSHIPILIQ